ncbi:MAG: hypothetical protein ACJ72Z_03490 [Pyrinomonadaceae bacterium]
MFGYEEVLELKSLFGVIDENEETPMMLEPIREPKSLFADSEEDTSSVSSFIDLDDPVIPKAPFWERQFSPEVTAKQTRFDWIYGVILPIICFAFDPIVFRDGVGHGWLGDYQIFAYVLSIPSIMSMAAWLLWKERLGWLIPFFGGLFAVGAAVSFVVGLAIFPISLLGLMLLIGALGFTPLISSFVYLRNSYRAYLTCDILGDTKFTTKAFILAAIFSFIAPFVIQQQFPLRRETPYEHVLPAD